MASGLFNSARAAFLKADLDWEAADVRCLLVQDTYTFDGTDVYVSDLVSHELGATDYVRKIASGLAVTGTNPTWADANNITWTGLGGATNQTIGGAVFYVYNASDSAAPLICCGDTSNIITQDLHTTIIFENGHVFNWSS